MLSSNLNYSEVVKMIYNWCLTKWIEKSKRADELSSNSLQAYI